MSTSANVHSSEAIEAVRAALLSFGERTGDAITSLELEMQRVVEWVEHDRPRHWKVQHRHAGDQLNEAKAALHRCLMFPKTVNDRPSCHEERLAVKKAMARLEYCENKAERVRHWKRVLPHEISEYKGRISRLKRLVEFEIPRAVGILNKLLLRLEEYNAVQVSPAQSAYSELSMVRELWDEVTNVVVTGEAGPGEQGDSKEESEETPGDANLSAVIGLPADERAEREPTE